MRSQSLCLVDEIYIEWHNGPYHPATLRGNAAALGIEPARAGATAVSTLINATKQMAMQSVRYGPTRQGAADDLIAPDCATRAIEILDETYRSDGQPWPERGSICARNPTCPCLV